MVLEHIQKLLCNHDCVIVPDFGGLITHYEPARIHPIRHSFLPPAKRVAFNEQLKLNDGLLISTLAYDKKLNADEAQAQVAQFVYNLQQELNQNRRCELKGIGVFRLNSENKINFEYIENENLLNDSFGLPELVSKPVISAEPARLRTLIKETANAEDKGFRATVRKYYRAAAALTVMGIAFTGLYFLSLQTDYNISAINPVALFHTENQREEESAELPVNEQNGQIAKADETVLEEPMVLDGAMPISEEASTATVERTQAGTGQSDNKVKANYTATSSKPIEVYNKDKVKIVVNTNTVISVSPSDDEPKNASAPKTSKENISPGKPVSKPEKAIVRNEELKRNFTAEEIKAAIATGKVSAKPETTNTEKSGNTATSTAPAIKNNAERFYVIVNGYSTYENAERNRKIIAKKGRPGKILPPAGDAKLYRIAIAEYPTKEQAVRYLPELKNKYGNKIWILKY